MIDNYKPPPPVYITRFTTPKPTQSTVQIPVSAKDHNSATEAVALQLHTPEDRERILDAGEQLALGEAEEELIPVEEEEPTLAEEEEAPTILTQDAAERSTAPLEAVYSKIRGADTIGLRVIMLLTRPREG
ncbi:MAG: hypothetical protein L6R42_009834 [Xanthoria sp. 1 TBL-2021]|nr:MAG: hypothetical protein L6R42_009834 [Xanthoria sp. 1 TBL-2021]